MRPISIARGFSLIEAVVVLVVAGILFAIAAPIFTDSEAKAGYFYDQVKSSVRYAQRQAIAQRRCVFVSVTATQVSLLYGDATCTATGPAVADFATNGAYVVTAPAGVAITPPAPAQFSFNGLGQPSAAVAFSVGSQVLTVEAESGYVH
jgi:MSHA pilin protein MshC